MHLEDVNIEGFKSFSEFTNMGFQPGIGVIIGNNGVGKSNILDAIVWALGEDDVSRLRCYAAEELFFCGSKDYPPAFKMKVELFVRQNNAKDLPRLRLVRERDRSGDETFWIQDQVVDKDAYVQEMEALCLKDSLKTIIRQEEINDAIQMNPRLRFEFIQKIFGMQEEDEVIEHLRRTTDPLFRNYFSLLMPLAEAKLELIRVNQAVGLEISVTLPGNRVRRSHQLSGGEKSVTSLALKLAVFKQLESPFYLLDEVEPSLDYINHKSMQALLKDVASQKQLIMITHLRSTIELANTLHGVRTRWDGSSFMKFYFVMDERLLRLYKCC